MRGKKKMLLFIFGIVLILAAAATAAWWYFAVAGGHGCNPPLPRATLTVGQASFDVEIATTLLEQSCGLSGRTGLADGNGMLFAFRSAGTQSFWMKDMNFPIDIVWIGGGKVVGFVENANPQAGAPIWKLKIYSSPPGVDKVLEIPAAAVARSGITIGDNVSGAGF